MRTIFPVCMGNEVVQIDPHQPAVADGLTPAILPVPRTSSATASDSQSTCEPPVADRELSAKARFAAVFFGIAYSIPEVANILRVGKKNVMSWVDAGHLPAFDVAHVNTKKRHLRVRSADLVEFVNSRSVNFKHPIGTPARKQAAKRMRWDAENMVHVIEPIE